LEANRRGLLVNAQQILMEFGIIDNFKTKIQQDKPYSQELVG
jgi:hypothetical protein